MDIHFTIDPSVRAEDPSRYPDGTAKSGSMHDPVAEVAAMRTLLSLGEPSDQSETRIDFLAPWPGRSALDVTAEMLVEQVTPTGFVLVITDGES